jgi:hypothetical protein
MNESTALLRDDNNERSANENENKNDASNDVDPFWGADVVVDDDSDDANGFDDDDDDDTSSVEGSEDQDGLPQRQSSSSSSSSTGKEILAIAIPALAGLAIDPLMVRTYSEY